MRGEVIDCTQNTAAVLLHCACSGLARRAGHPTPAISAVCGQCWYSWSRCIDSQGTSEARIGLRCSAQRVKQYVRPAHALQTSIHWHPEPQAPVLIYRQTLVLHTCSHSRLHNSCQDFPGDCAASTSETSRCTCAYTQSHCSHGERRVPLRTRR
jgi:hypothetical protein